MQQEVHGNRNIQINISGGDDGDRQLVKPQQEHIEELIAQVVALGVPEDKVRKVLRRTLGVENEQEILISQYVEATQCLEIQHGEAVSVNAKVALILKLPPDQIHVAYGYSQRKYHTRLFKSLALAQLDDILQHAQRQPHAPRKDDSDRIAQLEQQHQAEMIALRQRARLFLVIGLVCGVACTFIITRLLS